ncbi:MAG: hypothetical protein CMP58_03505 [Flavobacteriales bacterium]|nr:hypothetical protein [Flavobacteriales bacterium]
MSTGRAIQNAVVHVAVGVVAGAAIEAVMPAHSASSSASRIAFEVAVQAALNGVAVAMAGPALMADDPTFGLPFSTALLASQPEFARRIEDAAARVKAQVGQVLPQMQGRAAEAA